MRIKLYHVACLLTLAFCIQPRQVEGQCPTGFTRDTLNWDYLDFLPNSGRYVSPTAFINLAQSQAQRFSFGTQKLTFTHNYTGTNVVGDVTTHIAEVNSYGKGADLRFIGNGQLTIRFEKPVQAVKFSLYDVDKSQAVEVTARNVSTPIPVVLNNLPGSILTIAGSGSNTATATANSNEVGNGNNTPASNATVNVDVAGPVTMITIKITNTNTSGSEDGSYYVSDISACSEGTYPTDYYHISKPFAGQPSYVVAVLNSTVYYVDVATGVARKLFTDPAHTNINSLAYDPYRHMVYYAFSLTNSPQTNKVIKRYDYDMDTLGVFVSNVNTLGIPTYEDGVESAAAGFYNNSLYLGIEEADDGRTGRESTIWRIDFDNDYKPMTGVQAFALPVDNGGGTRLHDWSDIGINDGILYDFDGASGSNDIYHFNLLTGSGVNIKPPSGTVPRQVCVDWAGTMYNVGSGSSSTPGTIVPYNGNGTMNTTLQRTMSHNGVLVTGSWGDAAEAFKPKTDFGDAPASYDPPGIDPGTHERNDSLRLGDFIGIEWNKRTSSDATGDGAEEDGISGLQVIAPGTSNFVVPVKVYNTTGRNATLVGWVDANGDGVFSPSEGTTVTVPSNPAAQLVNILWSNIHVPLAPYAKTFLRLRIATTDLGISTSTPNGYFDNGEIEDYQISVSLLLPDQHVALRTQKGTGKTVHVAWELNNELGNDHYELQRSSNGEIWQTVRNRDAAPDNSRAAIYTYIDNTPDMPVSYYRVKVVKADGPATFSEISKVEFKEMSSATVVPNPARSFASLMLQSTQAGKGSLQLIDASGRVVVNESIAVVKGPNEYFLSVIQKLSKGMYTIRVVVNDEVMTTSLVVMK